MSDFIETWMNFTSDMESPKSFFLWSCFSCIGALLRDNVWIEYGLQKLFPNTYILLVADSAGYRKSVPPKLVCDILREVRNTKIIQGRTSIPGVLEELSQSRMDLETGEMITGGSCILVAEELAAFFVKDLDTIKQLTDLYDPRKEYTDNLRRAKTPIKNLCLSLLACSNEQFMGDIYGVDAVKGGLLRRTWLILPDGRRPPNSLFGEVIVRDLKPLIDIAKKISKLNGEMIGSTDAIEKYKNWYHKIYAYYDQNKDRTGIVESIHTSVLKLGLIIAAGRRQSLELEWRDIDEAIDLCISIIPNYKSFTIQRGGSKAAEIGSIFFTELWNSKKESIERKEFLRDHWTEFNLDDFTTFLDTVLQAGLVTSFIKGNSEHFKLTEEGKLKFKGALELK